MGRLSDIQWICYHGQCFRPPEDLSSELARKLDASANGIVTDRRGTAETPDGDFIWQGENDINGRNADDFERLIFDEFYERLPLREQKYLQVRVEPSYAALVQKPVDQIRGDVFRAMALARPRVEEIIGQPISDAEWTSIPVRLRTRQTKREDRWAGFVNTDPGRRRAEVTLFEHDELEYEKQDGDQADEHDVRLTVHELTHAILHVKAMQRGIRLENGGRNYPSWLCEGLAHLAESKYFSRVERRFSIGKKEAQSLDGFENFQYDNGHEGREEIDRAEAFLAMKYLVQTYGIERLQRLIAIITTVDQPFERSFEQAYNLPHNTLMASANRWVRNQIHYDRRVDDDGLLLAETLKIEGCTLWKKIYKKGELETHEDYKYDDRGLLAGVSVHGAKGDLIREEQYREGRLILVSYNPLNESRAWQGASLVQRLRWLTIDSPILGKSERLLIAEEYEGVDDLNDLSKGRLIQAYYLNMSRGRQSPGGGQSVAWHRLEHYTYRTNLTIRHGIVAKEEGDGKRVHSLSDIQLILDGLTVQMSFSYQELAWSDVFRDCEPMTCVQTENLSGGTVESIEITDGQGKIVLRVGKNDLNQSRFPALDQVNGYKFEFSTDSTGTKIVILSPDGKRLVSIGLSHGKARLVEFPYP